jgi:hypothetical protein
MRYDDWDILLFPTTPDGLNKIPLKEFRVSCHMLPDTEFSHTYACHGLPTMTCFVPSLPHGTPFHISVHSWRKPEVSAYTRSYSKHLELVKLEARVFVDGRLVAYVSLFPFVVWLLLRL